MDVVLLTVLLCKLLGLLIRHVSLGLQVGLVADQNDHLHTAVTVRSGLLFYWIITNIVQEWTSLVNMVASRYASR